MCFIQVSLLFVLKIIQFFTERPAMNKTAQPKITDIAVSKTEEIDKKLNSGLQSGRMQPVIFVFIKYI